MILTISGPPGSGKDTVAENLVSILNAAGFSFNIVSLGNVRREAAVAKGMTIEDFNTWSSENPKEGDAYFDDFQKQYGVDNDNFIMVSRLGWYFIPHAIKIYVDVRDDVGAKRIFDQKGAGSGRDSENEVSSVAEQMEFNLNRVENDKQRYSKLYNINPYDKSNYDLVIDSSEITALEVADKIIESLNFKKEEGSQE